jgi:tetratricopeptide (TPR) repeat protein
MRQDKLLESRDRVEAIIEAQPDDPVALRLLARIQTDLGDHDRASRTYEQLLEAEGRSADLWLLYGDSLRFLGRKVDSRIAYKRALALEPGFGQAWWGLVNLDPGQVTDEELAAMEDALAHCADRPDHAGNLHFALGTTLDAKGRYSDAFRHFEAGNSLARAAQPYDGDEINAQVSRYIAALPANAIPKRVQVSQASAPIFIVGMPRSGSTLVERILGRHSMIEPLGELPVAPHIVERLKLQQPEAGLEERVAGLGSSTLDELAERYRARAGDRRKATLPFFTDKLHMNWRHLGLILRMFPEARVIDVRRSALDCCWSNYKLLFARGHPASADLTDLGRFYRDYVRFLDHLNEVAPGRIHSVRYEQLVDDLEGRTREMLDYIGVPFEPACLEFHLSEQPVATASSEQVRRPLNRAGIGASRPYDEWLVPLRDALGSLADL